MANVVRYDFLGNPLVFWFLCLTVIGIPMAIIYLMTSTLRIEDSVENPEEFVARYKAGKI